MSNVETELEAPDPTASLDAADSTYEAAPPPDANPPSGPSVIQTLGQPGAAEVAPAKSKASSSSTTTT